MHVNRPFLIGRHIGKQREPCPRGSRRGPSRKYALILDRLSREAAGSAAQHRPDAPRTNHDTVGDTSQIHEIANEPIQETLVLWIMINPTPEAESTTMTMVETDLFSPSLGQVDWSLQEWQGEDWLNLDSMAFGMMSDG
ncbi:hypothetical protein F4778DRAFT_349315 [Xylariomycetidae sp. FL2044]|nr:hypothetical protein F4778DRAFT_349315 [Xylariomycetidae sp. FL2044]